MKQVLLAIIFLGELAVCSLTDLDRPLDSRMLLLRIRVAQWSEVLMTDDELLTTAESVLVDVIAEVEFTRLPKDLAYAQAIVDRIEKRRAKNEGRPLMQIKLELRGGRVYSWTTLDRPFEQIETRTL